MKLTKDDKDWLISSINARVEHIASSPETKKELKRLDDQIQNRVTYRIFIWILGILLVIIMGLFSYITTQIHDLRDKTYAISNSVSTIAGYIDSTKKD